MFPCRLRPSSVLLCLALVVASATAHPMPTEDGSVSDALAVTALRSVARLCSGLGDEVACAKEAELMSPDASEEDALDALLYVAGALGNLASVSLRSCTVTGSLHELQAFRRSLCRHLIVRTLIVLPPPSLILQIERHFQKRNGLESGSCLKSALI